MKEFIVCPVEVLVDQDVVKVMAIYVLHLTSLLYDVLEFVILVNKYTCLRLDIEVCAVGVAVRDFQSKISGW